MSFDTDPFGTTSFDDDGGFEDFDAFEQQSPQGDDFFGAPQRMDWADSQFGAAPIVTGVKKTSVAEDDDWFDAHESISKSQHRKKTNGAAAASLSKSQSARHAKKNFPDNAPRGDATSTTPPPAMNDRSKKGLARRRASLSSHGIGKQKGPSRHSAEEKSVQSAMELGSRSRRRRTLQSDQQEDDAESASTHEHHHSGIGGSHHRKSGSRRHLVKGRSKKGVSRSNSSERPGGGMSKSASSRSRLKSNSEAAATAAMDQPLENFEEVEEEQQQQQHRAGPTGKRRIRSTNSAGPPSTRSLSKASSAASVGDGSGDNEERGERRRIHRRGSRKMTRSRSNDLSGIIEAGNEEAAAAGPSDVKSVQSSRSSVRSGGRRRISSRNLRAAAEAMAGSEHEDVQQQPPSDDENDNDKNNEASPEDFKAALEEEGSESEDERLRRQTSSLGLGNGLDKNASTSRRRIPTNYLPMNLTSIGGPTPAAGGDDDADDRSTSSGKVIDRIRSRSSQRRGGNRDRSVSIDRNAQKVNARAEERRKKRLSIRQQLESDEGQPLASSISGVDTYSASSAMRGLQREVSDSELVGIRKGGGPRGVAPAGATKDKSKRRASSVRNLDARLGEILTERRAKRAEEQTSLFTDED